MESNYVCRTISRFLYLLRGGSHSSGPAITAGSSDLPGSRNGAGRSSSPIWSCSAWGFPCQPDYSGRGALLPHLFTLTPALTAEAVYFLWHFP